MLKPAVEFLDSDNLDTKVTQQVLCLHGSRLTKI